MKLGHISQHPLYAAATTEINDLSSALAKVRGRLQEIEILASAPAAVGKDSANIAAALEFAAGGHVTAASSRQPNGLSEERRALADQEAALVRAIDTRHRDLNALVSELSAALARDLAAKHKALARQYLEKLQELDAVVEQEAHMVATIERAGYDARFGQRLAGMQGGRLDDSSGSPMYYHARELRAYLA